MSTSSLTFLFLPPIHHGTPFALSSEHIHHLIPSSHHLHGHYDDSPELMSSLPNGSPGCHLRCWESVLKMSPEDAWESWGTYHSSAPTLHYLLMSLRVEQSIHSGLQDHSSQMHPPPKLPETHSILFPLVSCCSSYKPKIFYVPHFFCILTTFYCIVLLIYWPISLFISYAECCLSFSTPWECLSIVLAVKMHDFRLCSEKHNGLPASALPFRIHRHSHIEATLPLGYFQQWSRTGLLLKACLC